MSENETVGLILSLGCLVLVGSALIARGQSLGQSARMAAIWVAIFTLGILLYGVKDDARALFMRSLYPERGTVVGETLRIPMADDGHFWISGQINGVETRFLVDSGASLTAIGTPTMRAAGLQPDSQDVAVETANGVVVAHRLTINELTVGPFAFDAFSAITADQFGDSNVLGMNFLSTFGSWGVEDRTLILRP